MILRYTVLYYLIIIFYYMTTYGATFKEARTRTQKNCEHVSGLSSRTGKRQGMINKLNAWPRSPRCSNHRATGHRCGYYWSHFNQGFSLVEMRCLKTDMSDMPIFVIFLLSWTVFLCQQRCWYSCWYWKKSPAMKTWQGISILRGVPQSGLVRSHQWCSEYGQRRLQPWKIATKSSDHFPSDIGSLLLLFFLFTFTLVPFRGKIIEDS